jgi:hypothetical protein
VDNDVIEVSNEERLFTSANPNGDINLPKAVHARQFLKSINVQADVFDYKTTFERFVDSSRDRLNYVFCCLDNVAARRVLQTELASVVVNGGTDLCRWMVSLHDFERPENACLLDLYKEPPENQADSMQKLFDILRMRPDEMLQLQQRHGRIDGRAILKAQQQEPDLDLKQKIGRLMGLTFEEALGHVCSSAAPNKALPAATISFVSLIPAVFMVADFVKRRALGWKLQPAAPNIFQVDSFRAFEKGTFINVLASEKCFCRSKRYTNAFAKRLMLRKPYPWMIFSSPSYVQTEPVLPVFFHRRLNARLQRRIRPAVKPPPAAGIINAANPPMPLPDCTGRLPGVRRCFFGLMIYIVGLLLSLLLLSLFISYESQSKNLWEQWRIVPLSWAAGKNFRSWSKYSAVLGGFTFIYLPLMKVATRVMRNSGNSKCSLPGEQKSKRITPQKAHKILSTFFAATALPITAISCLSFLLLNIHAFFTCCQEVGEAGCCAIIFVLIFFFYLVLIIVALGLGQLFEITRDRCAWALNLPIKKKPR